MTTPAASPRPAATVILVRPAATGFEVLLVRRNLHLAFMADAFVFPGGKIDSGETPEQAAARELLEEAGVLVAPGAGQGACVELRRRLAAGEGSFAALLAEGGLTLDPAALLPWALWITPSVEPRRFAAHFYLARMPAGQEASHDQGETTARLWIAPAAAVSAQARGELKLPPPTLRNLEELSVFADVAALFAAAGARRDEIVPIQPKFIPLPDGALALLLPWDPEYAAAPGEGVGIPEGHRLRTTSSRIVLAQGRWWNR
jgi:8-oxo-dGTP pyrophosphatase MutT (NUDIX family)